MSTIASKRSRETRQQNLLYNLDYYLGTHFKRFAAELSSLIKIPSISADPRYQGAMFECARHLISMLRNVGFAEVQLIPNGNLPLVFAQKIIHPDLPTVLLYGHYDVQPLEDEKLWQRKPFSGEVAQGQIWGRGASDNKGQFFAHLKALEYIYHQQPDFPVNVKILLEGEEEMGSLGLCKLIQDKPKIFQADLALVSDTQMPHPHQPVIHHALRGNLSMELILKSENALLHSGNFGGIVQNPIEVAAGLVAGIHGRFGRIKIPGIYEQVKVVEAREILHSAQQARYEEKLLASAGLSQAWGEKGYSMYERLSVRPALTVTGIEGGYIGPGIKSMVPNLVKVKLNLRLVPNQDPSHIDQLLRRYFATQVPASMQLTCNTQALVKAYEIPIEHPYIQLASKALVQEFGRQPMLLRSGGTIPPVSALAEAYEMPVILIGFGLPEDKIHAPNEKFSLQNFRRAIRFSVRFFHHLSQVTHDHRLPLSCR